MKFAIQFVVTCAALACATATYAQHAQGTAHGHAAPTAAQPSVSPYAGQQVRSIKALSDVQTQGLLEGRGMELALAAELNGYPGPMHTLELAEPLGLSVAQRQSTQMLLERHKAEARSLGAELVHAERALDEAFRTRQIDATGLKNYTDHIAKLQAALRNSHLQTHLQQAALLTPQQISRYAELRGYRTTVSVPAPTPASSHNH